MSILNSFKIKDQLELQVWQDNKLNFKVRENLLSIADDFIESLDLKEINLEEKIKIIDIVLTGSLAGYNWSNYSDVDLHIIYDSTKIDNEDKELVKEYLQSKKTIWNINHNIKIFGYDVEVYPQDEQEKLVSSGVYSIQNNEWISESSKENVKINKDLIIKKVNDIINIINKTLKKELTPEEEIKALDKIKDKINKSRKEGLAEDGEYSIGNLVFKVLRRLGTIEKIKEIKTNAFDKEMTLEGYIKKLELLTESKVLLIKEWVDVVSSNLDEVEYDNKKKELKIIFKNSPVTYIFKDVPGKVYAGMMWSRSKGKYFHRNIKNKYDFKKTI